MLWQPFRETCTQSFTGNSRWWHEVPGRKAVGLQLLVIQVRAAKILCRKAVRILDAHWTSTGRMKVISTNSARTRAVTFSALCFHPVEGTSTG